MALEKKRARIYDYCRHTLCENCVLRVGGWFHTLADKKCLSIFDSPETDLDRAIDIIEGKTDPEDIEIACPTCRFWDSQYDDTECVGCKNRIVASDPLYETAPLKWTPANNSTDDPVNRPSHYTAGKIECIDAIEESMTPDEWVGFLKGQVIKYLWRYRLKGKPVEDLKKARFYLDRLIQATEKEEVAV